jgi:hypothetical protein
LLIRAIGNPFVEVYGSIQVKYLLFIRMSILL